MSVRILKTVAPGIALLTNGRFRVRASVGKAAHGGITHEKTFPPDAGLREMKRWQRDESARIREEHPVTVVKGTFADDLLRYLGITQNRLQFPKKRVPEISAWMQRFGGRRRHTIKRDEVREQVRDWLIEGVAASTVKHRLSALSQLFVLLDGEDAYNPARRVRRPAEPLPAPNGRSMQTIQTVLDAMTERVLNGDGRGWGTLARLRLMAFTGARQSQVMRLTADDFLLHGNVPYIVVSSPGKNGLPHAKPLSEEGVDAAKLFLWVGCLGEFSDSSLRKAWLRACVDAAVAPFTPYLLRHSYATALRGQGMDLADVQHLLGHKSPKTTARYAGIAPQKLAAAAAMIQAAWHSSQNAARVGALGRGNNKREVAGSPEQGESAQMLRKTSGVLSSFRTRP